MGDYTICDTTGKRGWPSKRIAISATRRAGNRLRAYRCPVCHLWHVTHYAYEDRGR